MKFFRKLFGSLDNSSEGYSGRKMSAMVSVLTAIWIAVKLLPKEDLLYAFYAFLGFALLCLGLVTIPQLIEFLSDKPGKIKETVKTETTTEKAKE
jgi:hypothetical protein